MTHYFTAPDGADEPTIWERADGDPAAVVRRAELPGPQSDLLWRVLTGVLCADDETVGQMARALHIPHCAPNCPKPPASAHQDARAALAALREVQ